MIGTSFLSTIPPWVLLGAGMVTGWVKSFWSWIYGHTIGYLAKKVSVSIHIEEVEHPEAYAWIVDWAEAQLTARRVTDVMLRRKPNRDEDRKDSGYVLIPFYGTYYLWWRSRYFMVFENIKESSDKGNEWSVGRPKRTAGVTLWGTLNRQFLLDLLVEAKEVFDAKHPKHLYLYTNKVYGDTYSQRLMKRRPLDSIYLPENVIADVLEDFASFFASETRYKDLGIPWRKGYLFEGPPGTGKSSLIQCLASHFEIATYYVTLRSDMSASDLLNVFDYAVGPCLVVIEDADCIVETQERDSDKEKGFKMNDLLNAIDGLVASEQRILIITTNHMDKLDPALLRNGRIDRKFHIGYAADEEIKRFYDRAENWYHLDAWKDFRADLPIRCTIADAQALAFRSKGKVVELKGEKECVVIG